MKRTFFAGLATLLPILVTYLIVSFVVNFLTKPFLGLAKYLFPAGNPVLVIQIFILLILFFVVIFVGWLGQQLILSAVFHSFHQFMHRIPFVNKIYRAVQEGLKTFFSDSTRPPLSKRVQVPFPHPDAKASGFITNENILIENKQYTAVLILGTPNPTMGFLLFLPIEKIIDQ